MKKEPNVIVNYFYNLSYKLLAILVPLITTPYISRVLRAEAIGAYSYVQSIATYFSIFGIMGLNLYGQLEISKNRDHRQQLSRCFWEIFAAKLITSLLSLGCYLALILVYGHYRKLMFVMGILVAANMLDISWMFQGLEEFKKIVIRNYIIKLLGLVLILLLIRSEADLYLYALIIQGSTLLGNASLWWNIGKYVSFCKMDPVNVCRHIRQSLIYFLPTIATTIYTYTDKIMLGAMIHSDFENGLYEQAHKIEQVVITIVSSMNTVLLPRLSYLHSDDRPEELDRYIQTALQAAAFLLIPMMFGLWSVADVLIPVFLGEEFTGAISLLRIFALLLLFSGMNTIIGNSCLVAFRRQKEYNIGVFTGAAVNVVLNYLLIPAMKGKGAAIASLLSEAAVFLVFICYTNKKTICLTEMLKKMVPYTAAALPMALVVWWIGEKSAVTAATLLLQILVGGSVYLGAVILMRDPLIRNFIRKSKKTGV